MRRRAWAWLRAITPDKSRGELVIMDGVLLATLGVTMSGTTDGGWFQRTVAGLIVLACLLGAWDAYKLLGGDR